jgi:hypothetical protein
MIRVLAGEGYAFIFAIVVFGIPMGIWSLGEDWAKNSESKSFLLLVVCLITFGLGAVVMAKLIGFIES